MYDFISGFVAGGFAAVAIMHLVYQKRLTFKGWIEKSENPSKYWSITSFYSLVSAFMFLYMIYT